MYVGGAFEARVHPRVQWGFHGNCG